MKRFLVLALAVIMNVAASAVTIEECCKQARERYPLLKQYDILALTEKYSLAAASRAWLPQVGVSMQATWQSDMAAYPEALADILRSQGTAVSGMKKDHYQAQIELRQTIYDGGHIRAQKEKAKALAEEQRAATAVELYEVEGRVEEVFFAILLLERQRDAVRSSINTLTEDLRLMSAMQREGKATQSDCDALEAELLSMKQQLTGIRFGEHAYRTVLALYTGMMESVTLEKPKDKGVIFSTPYTYRPEMRLFEAQEHSIKAQEREVRSQLTPTLGAFGQAHYGYPGLNYMDAMLNHDWKTGAMVGVRLQWNIGALYTRRPMLDRLKAQRDAVAVQRDVFKFNQNIVLRRQYDEVRRLEEVMKDDQRIVELRQNVRQAAEAQMRDEGTVNTVLLLQRINDEMQARIQADTHEIERLRTCYQSNHTGG